MTWAHRKRDAAVTIDAVTEYRWSFPYDLLLTIKVHETGETSVAIELREDAQREDGQRATVPLEAGER